MIRPRTHLEAIYRTPDDPESHLSYLRLDKNERIVPFPEHIIARFHELLTPDAVMAYPELEQLYQKLADYLGVERNSLFLASGSDLAIKTVYETYIDPGGQVQIHLPSYAMQEVYGKIFQARVVTIPYNQRLELDINVYIDAITPRTRMVLLENPNGFIGTIQSLDAVRAIAEKARRCNTLMMIDEAYYLFSNQTVQSLYREFENVIIVRTFSKDLGIAGLRCGYLLSQPQNIESLYRVKPMHEVNSAAVALALALLEYPEHIHSFVREVQAGVQLLKDSLREMGLVTAGGHGNFIVVYLGEGLDAVAVVRHLKSRGILIRRPFQQENLKGWLRIGAGSVAQMQQFVPAFAEALEVAGWRADHYLNPLEV